MYKTVQSPDLMYTTYYSGYILLRISQKLPVRSETNKIDLYYKNPVLNKIRIVKIRSPNKE